MMPRRYFSCVDGSWRDMAKRGSFRTLTTRKVTFLDIQVHVTHDADSGIMQSMCLAELEG